MALTGFQTARKSASICKGCADEAGLPTSSLREVKDNQFRHGDGGAPCVFCGLDTMDMLARKVLRGRTEAELATPDDVEDEVDVVDGAARILEAAFSGVSAHIALAPGCEPVEQEIAPGVTAVDHPEDAEETLILDVEDEVPSILERREESLCDALEALGWRYEVTLGAKSDGAGAQIRAVPDGSGLPVSR